VLVLTGARLRPVVCIVLYLRLFFMSHLFVATWPAFILDSNALGPNLFPFNGGLCVRNLVNKAWTTVRGNRGFSSGFHFWEVRVDKCVSKNIFVGVSSAEASLGNYVGSDNQGWGYLANTALWHKKVGVSAAGGMLGVDRRHRVGCSCRNSRDCVRVVAFAGQRM